MNSLIPSDCTTFFSYKGSANYFYILALGSEGKNAGRTYERPFDAVKEIGSYLAFYADKVSI